MDILVIALSVAYILLLYFNSNAFVEYWLLFRLPKFKLLKEYLETQKNGIKEGIYYSNFIEYLYQEYATTYLIKLITCPLCLNTVLCLIISSCIYSIKEWLFLAFLSLFFYGLLCLIWNNKN
jgi:hypothetical protein